MFNREEYILTDSPIKNDLLSLFKKDQKLIILDIGGCEGEESIRYSRIFPNSLIYCFEPLPKNQKRIVNNVEKYNIKNVRLIECALSDKEGQQLFYVSSGQPSEQSSLTDWDFGNKSSSLLPPDKHIDSAPWIKFDESITISVRKLSDFLTQENIFNVDFIHMDVQGAELKVLTGAEVFIKKIKAIWLEVSDITLYQNQPTRIEMEIFMKKNGFDLIKTFMDGGIGEQMYLNKRYFRTISIFSLKKIHLRIKK